MRRSKGYYIVMGVLHLFYLSLCVWVLVFVSTPLSLVGLAAGFMAGACIGIGNVVSIFVGRSTGASVFTPGRVAAGDLPGRVDMQHVRRDRAWPQYFALQFRLDMSAVIQSNVGTVGAVWESATAPFLKPSRRKILYLWPLLLIGVITLAGFSAGAAAIVVIALVVLGVATAVIRAIGLATIAVLRAIDVAWQRVFHAAASCPRCFHVTSLPAYRCPGLHSTEQRRVGDDLHRDLRPGRLGVFWRTCACGRRLPTTVLRASRRLDVCCPVCAASLHKGAAVATDVRIPVFGAASSGKTHLIVSAVVTLLSGTPPKASGVTADLIDEHSKRRYQEYRALVLGNQSMPKTDAAQQPIALTVRIRDNRHETLVHLFDAAGEALADPDLNASYAYFDYARTLVFVLDPFSIPDVRDQMAGAFSSVFQDANPAQGEPESAYQATVSRLHVYGVRTNRQHLAFVLSKRDLLAPLPIARSLNSDSAAIRAWLIDRGLDNLVVGAERDFQSVRFFLVASKDGTSKEGGSMDGSSEDVSPKDREEAAAIAPIRWLLETERVGLTGRSNGLRITTQRTVQREAEEVHLA